MNAAIFFEPDGYTLGAERIMGRQSAGAAFFKAAVAGLSGETLYAYTPRWQSAEAFSKLVNALDPTAETSWIPPDRLDLLAKVGTLYTPGPDIGDQAFLRLPAGSGAYSIVGVTHTIASHRPMEAITSLLTAPVMPWDALICTSTVARAAVETLVREQADYLQWRFGVTDVPVPNLPVIPLGVHCDDYIYGCEEKNQARRDLGIMPDEVVVLFFGRLCFHAKAHPHAMLVALNETARRTGKPVTMVLCGIFPNAGIEKAFKDGIARFAPDTRVLYLDGQDDVMARRSWACADIFVSLSDNIQETFGLTPLEAMAAGLPVVVTDWDGYKDTVRDGIDGFRIPTWMPAPPLGEFYASQHGAGMINYDRYVGLACQNVSVDRAILAEKLDALVSNPDLRRRMGEAGQARAREVFDWSVIFGQYQALWKELAAIRNTPAERAWLQPRNVPHRHDPFHVFSSYPTHRILPTTSVLPREDPASFEILLQDPLFSYAKDSLPSPGLARRLVSVLSVETATTMEEIAARSGERVNTVMFSMSCLAKAGVVRLVPPDAV
ncbi:MAG: glycosyltransferase family 4 protein [Solidesulfovibrio sp.]